MFSEEVSFTIGINVDLKVLKWYLMKRSKYFNLRKLDNLEFSSIQFLSFGLNDSLVLWLA